MVAVTDRGPARDSSAPRDGNTRCETGSGTGALRLDPVIRLEGVTCRFGDSVVVDKLSLSVSSGEIVALVGRTGAGKSTALNLMMGTLPPTEGSVTALGLDPYRQFRQLRGKLAVSFQTDRLLPWRTARQNIETGLQVLGKKSDESRRIAMEWLSRVQLEGAADHYPHQLSGGMRQRVSLARALAIDPDILLLDESFSQLDHVTSQTLRRDVSKLLRSLGKTCVFITHRIDDALEMADRILVLAPPAHIVSEVALTAADRQNPQRLATLHAEIATALEL